jgi:hypothetical protein
MSWGVTVVKPQMKEMARKAGKEVVRQRASHCLRVSHINDVGVI